MSAFSDFIRNASLKEKEAVYSEVMEKATERQKASRYVLKTLSGDYVGEGGTFNSQRDYAKRFASEEEGRDYAKANRMHAEFIAEKESSD